MYHTYMNVFQSLLSGATVSMTEEFSLEDIISDGLGDYYRYSGSLTTPPSYESVIWTVFEKPIPISSRQVNIPYVQMLIFVISVCST